MNADGWSSCTFVEALSRVIIRPRSGRSRVMQIQFEEGPPTDTTCNHLEGDPSGMLKPPVDSFLTVPAVDWPLLLATYCTGSMAEHLKSKSTGGLSQPDGSPCTSIPPSCFLSFVHALPRGSPPIHSKYRKWRNWGCRAV